MLNFADLLTSTRSALKLTRAEVVTRALDAYEAVTQTRSASGIDVVALGFWETGKRVPSPLQTRCLCTALELDDNIRRRLLEETLPAYEAEARARTAAKASGESPEEPVAAEAS